MVYDQNANPVLNTILKDSSEGSMIYLYKNYNDIFGTMDTLTKTNYLNTNAVAHLITSKLLDNGSTFISIFFVYTDGNGETGAPDLGATAGFRLTPVRPVVVISKDALN